MGSHKHAWQPFDVVARAVKLCCAVCGKRKNARATRCEPCDLIAREYQRAIQVRANRYVEVRNQGVEHALAEIMAGPLPKHWEPGCDRCFRGWVVPEWTSPCCCFKDAEKCLDCEAVADRNLPHVCLVLTAEELDHEWNVATMATPRHDAPAAATKAMAASMDQSQGPRAPKH